MFKRIRWMGIGAAAGSVATLWVQGRVRRERAAHPSVDLGVRAAQGLRTIGSELRDAVVDGREAMAARETALRGEVGTRFGTSRREPLRLVDNDPSPGDAASSEPDETDGTTVVRPARSGRHPAGADRRHRTS